MSNTTGYTGATEVFAGILKDAKVITVDPAACIPFIRIRDVVPSGVRRIKHSYVSADSGSFASGAVAGGFLPTVVALNRNQRRCAVDYFVEECSLPEEDAIARVETRTVWYGMVDGNHRLQALLELGQQHPEQWGGFNWCVLLLNPGHQMSTLRAFARGQNLRQRDDVFVETTLFDVLSELKTEAHRLSSRYGGRSPSARELSDCYCACHERTSTSIRHHASLAIKLHDDVVSAIGDIINTESAHLACLFYSLKQQTTCTPETVGNIADCRIYRNFVTVNALKQASAFLHTKGAVADEARVHALYRAKEICHSNGFRPVSHKTLGEQFLKAIGAVQEAKKFEELLQTNIWPRGMESVRLNLLRNTVLDSEVESNEGNDVDILPSLLRHLRRACPERASMMEERYYASHLHKAATAAEKEEGPREETTELHGQVACGNSASAAEKEEGEVPSRDLVPEREDENRRTIEGDLNLQQLGISSYNMSWQDYNTAFNSTTDSMFDLVVTEPPRGVAKTSASISNYANSVITKSEMQEFVAFAKRVLMPGGYIVILTPAHMFMDWVQALRMHEIGCVEYPFVITYDTKGLQRNNRLLFPQQVSDLAVMGMCPGKHPNGFKANFHEEYTSVSCTLKRKFAAMDQAPIARKKLREAGSRAFVRCEEKSSDVLAELMVTFSREGARVLDPFAGTMSVAAACMSTGRHCTVVETDTDCFKLALDRLRTLSNLYVGSPLERLRVKAGMSPLLRPEDLDSESAGSKTESLVVARGSEEEEIPPIPESPNSCEIPSVPSSGNEEAQSEIPSDHIENDKRVQLLREGEVVGSAEMQMGDDGPRTELHGLPLSRYAKDDEKLVVVYRIIIYAGCEDLYYPYNFGGVEDPPKKLGDITGGFYAWDLNSIDSSTTMT